MNKHFALFLASALCSQAAFAASEPLSTASDQAGVIVGQAKHAEIAHHLDKAIALRQQIRETLFAYGKKLDRQVVGEVHGSFSSYMSGSFFLLAGGVSGESEGQVDGTMSQLTMQGGEFFSLLIRGDSADKFLSDPALDVSDPGYPLQCRERIKDAREEVSKAMPWSKMLELADVMKQFRSQMEWLEPALAKDSASGNQREAFENLRVWAQNTKVYPHGIWVIPYEIVKYHETGAKGQWANQLSYVYFRQGDGKYDQHLYLIGRDILLRDGHVTGDCAKGDEILDYMSEISTFQNSDDIERMLRVY